MLKPSQDANSHHAGTSTHKNTALAGLALRIWKNQKSTVLYSNLQPALFHKEQSANITHDFSTTHYIKFDFGTISEPEALIIQGSLLCIASPLKPRKIAAVTKHNKAWAVKNKICTAKNPILVEIVPHFMSAFKQTNNEALKIYSDYATLIFMLDDLLNVNWEKLSAVKDLQKILKTFFAHLKGLPPKDTIKNAKINFPKYKQLCQAFFDIGSRLCDQRIETKYFLNSAELYFNNLIKDFTVRFNHAGLSLDEQLNVRAIVSGLDTLCELAYALQNIHLAPVVRENSYFKQLQQHAYTASIIANDILALNKQLKKKQVGNNYILLKQELTKNSLPAIFNECQFHYNTEISRFVSKTQALLNSIHTTDYAATLNALVTMANHVQARLDWALQTARYQEKMAKIKFVTKA